MSDPTNAAEHVEGVEGGGDPPREERLARALPWLVGALALAIYVPATAPTLVVAGDSATFASAARVFGVPQPSGYPLYVLLAGAFSRLPLGADVAHRIHLFSAVVHALAVALVARTAVRLGCGWVVSAVAGLALAFSRSFFAGSLYAEPFPLLDLLTVVVLERALVAHGRPDGRALFVLAALIGVASTHHQMIALLAPALAWLALSARWDRAFAAEPRWLARAGLAFVLPLVLAYGWLFIRARQDPAVSWGDVRSFADLARLATRSDYGGVWSPHLGTGATTAGSAMAAWLDGIADDFGWGALALAAVGAASGWRHRARRPATVALVLATLASGPLFAIANDLDTTSEHGRAFAARFSTMSAVPMALLLALGLTAAIDKLSIVFPRRALLTLSASLAIAPWWTHHRAVDLGGDVRGRMLAEDMLFGGSGTEDDALILYAGDGQAGAMAWLCGVERRCGGRIVFSPGQLHLDWRVRQLARRYPSLVVPAAAGKFVTTTELVAANVDRRPIYLAPALLDNEPALRRYQVLPRGLLVRVYPGDDAERAARAAAPEEARAWLASVSGARLAQVRRASLGAPSLEIATSSLYALSFENHARILAAYHPGESVLAAALADRADAIDPDYVAAVRRGLTNR